MSYKIGDVVDMDELMKLHAEDMEEDAKRATVLMEEGARLHVDSRKEFWDYVEDRFPGLIKCETVVRTHLGVIEITDVPDEPEPEPVPAADMDVIIDTSRRHDISALVYGHNQPVEGLGLGLVRGGGNRWSAYNWENNASNAGSDWDHQNDTYLGGGDAPGGAVKNVVDRALALGALPMITVPMIGHVAADKGGGGDVDQTPDYLNTRFRRSQAAKGAEFNLTPDGEDGDVFQDEFVNWLRLAYPQMPLLLSLDNEPDLWSATHPRIHPQAVTYQELVDLTREYAQAIKNVAPEAVIFGPVNYGWAGMVNLQSAADADGRDFLDFYLSQVADVVDVLDVHWYPEERGAARVTGQETDLLTSRARMGASNSLWDPDYRGKSWINDVLGEPIRLIPRLREKIGDLGTKIAITEYYFGGGDHISGGIAQALALGVFGREGVYAAALWPMGRSDDTYINAAFRAFRDYDGQGSRFGDVGVATDHPDVFASLADDKVVVVAVNKAPESKTLALHVDRPLTTALAYHVHGESPNIVRALAPGVDGRRLALTLRPNSITIVEAG